MCDMKLVVKNSFFVVEDPERETLQGPRRARSAPPRAGGGTVDAGSADVGSSDDGSSVGKRGVDSESTAADRRSGDGSPPTSEGGSDAQTPPLTPAAAAPVPTAGWPSHPVELPGATASPLAETMTPLDDSTMHSFYGGVTEMWYTQQQQQQQQLQLQLQLQQQLQQQAFNKMIKDHAAHAAGTCRPCLHAFRPLGCRNGFSCQFCHLPGHPPKPQRPSKSTRLKLKDIKQDLLDKNASDEVVQAYARTNRYLARTLTQRLDACARPQLL